MSDLISRNELLKRFCINKDGHRIPERDCDNFEVTVSVKDVKTIIKEQPTAYSVDKVVKELNKLDVKAIKRYKGGTFGDYEGTDYYIKKSEAIEIVKQSGVSDDTDNVCKWYKVNGNACKCYTHAEIYDSRVIDWCVCPYCGRKIRLVD